jgi:hypothetical protein
LITTDEDRAGLEASARTRKAPLGMAQRAWIVVAADDGHTNAQRSPVTWLCMSPPVGPGAAGSLITA